MISVYHVIFQDYVIKVRLDFMGKSPSWLVIGSYNPINSGSHRLSGNGDIMFSVCHVVSEDHVDKGSCDFVGGNLS